MNIPFNFTEYVDQTNKAFKKSNKARRRVLLAKDGLLRLKEQNIMANNSYIVDLSRYNYNSEASFKDTVNNGHNCLVCAKGALLVSAVGRFNGYTNVELNFNSTKNAHKELEKYFTLEQLDMIEIAFEGRSFMGILAERMVNDIAEASDIYKKCEAFYTKYPNKDNRLKAILENIVENKGEFIP